MKVAKRIVVWCALVTAVALFVACPPNGLLTDLQDKVQQARAGSGQIVEPPAFSISAGTYSLNISVTISDLTTGATIYYTVTPGTTGTTPTTSSAKYTGAIPVAGNGTTDTIEAIAVNSGITNSETVVATYVINYSQVSTPGFSPNGASNLAQPESVTVTDLTNGATIYYATSTNGTAPTISSPPPASPWTAYPGQIVVGGDQTAWVIVAQAMNGGMANSTIAISLAYTVSLAVPAISSVGSATFDNLTVSWNTVSGATGYNVFRDVSSSGSFSTEVATNLSSTTTSYQNSGLSSGTTYWYKVQANYTGGPNLLSRSNAASGTTLPPPALMVDSVTSTTVTLSWTTSSSATSYQLFSAASASGPFTTQVYTGANTNYTDTGLSLDTTYYYEVQAKNPGGSSALSGAVSGTPAVPPATPTGLSAPGNQPRPQPGNPPPSIPLVWTASTGAISYQLYSATNASGPFSEFYSGTVIGASYSGGTPGTTYYFEVQATNLAGSSALSSAFSVVFPY